MRLHELRKIHSIFVVYDAYLCLHFIVLDKHVLHVFFSLFIFVQIKNNAYTLKFLLSPALVFSSCKIRLISAVLNI